MLHCQDGSSFCPITTSSGTHVHWQPDKQYIDVPYFVVHFQRCQGFSLFQLLRLQGMLQDLFQSQYRFHKPLTSCSPTKRNIGHVRRTCRPGKGPSPTYPTSAESSCQLATQVTQGEHFGEISNKCWCSVVQAKSMGPEGSHLQSLPTHWQKIDVEVIEQSWHRGFPWTRHGNCGNCRFSHVWSMLHQWTRQFAKSAWSMVWFKYQLQKCIRDG